MQDGIIMQKRHELLKTAAAAGISIPLSVNLDKTEVILQ